MRPPLPEIEMPGHALAALSAFPSLGCMGGPYQAATFWGIFDDVYCAGNDSTFTFLQNLLDEVVELFPSKYIHIGGDDLDKRFWEKCPKCAKRMKDEGLKNVDELQSYFITRMERFLNSKGRRIIGWDEILEGGISPDATVMSWRGVKGGIEAAHMGHDVVMTPTTFAYLDYQQGEASVEPPLYAGLRMKKSYSFDPVPEGVDAKHILGGQGNSTQIYWLFSILHGTRRRACVTF